MANIIDVTDDTLENEVFNSELPVLIDFWATWCGPCRKLSPVIEELAEEFTGKVKFVKIKVDENVACAQKFSVIGVPCLILLKNSRPVERIVNVLPKNPIKNIISKHID